MTGHPKFACKECGRQFVEKPQKHYIAEETNALIDKLLLERLSLAGIVRVTGVSARWLQEYVDHNYADVPCQVEVHLLKKRRLTLECDELWSFVGCKAQEQWGGWQLMLRRA